MRDRSPTRISGIILAGGASRRMGQDKAFLQVGGELLIDRVLKAVRAVADDIIIVTNSPEKYAGYPARLIRDAYPGTGALGGIYTGLLAAEHSCGIVVACDMPFLKVDLLQYMAGQIEQYDVVIPYVGDDQPSANTQDAALRQAPRRAQEGPQEGSQDTARARDLHPLHAIYCKRCLEPIERAIGRGDLRAIAFLPEVRVRFVGRQEIARFDPEHCSFFNANTPEELRYAQELTKIRSFFNVGFCTRHP
ncbi:MAG: molybdenum cofactor guanylyltransferase [Anaerolineae bacterium]